METDAVPSPARGEIPESDRVTVTSMHVGDIGTQTFIKTKGNVIHKVDTIQQQHIYITDPEVAKMLLNQNGEGTVRQRLMQLQWGIGGGDSLKGMTVELEVMFSQCLVIYVLKYV